MGNSSVGKSSIVQRYMNDKFPEYHDPTIHAQYTKVEKLQNKNYKINIFDSAGKLLIIYILGEQDYQNIRIT